MSDYSSGQPSGGDQPGQPTQPPTWQTPPPRYQPPQQSQRSAAWRWGCGFALAGCMLVIIVAGFLLLMGVISATGGFGEISTGGEQAVLIRIDGMIVAGQSGFSMLGGAATGSDDVVSQIERATEDRNVKGILLRINSPGGSAAASQEIYNAVQKAREDGMIVVASMADVAASGGYYVAASSDRVFADPATLTGSIGVIAMHQDMSELFKKLGIESEVVKSGALKDMLQPTKPLSDEARAVLEALVTQVHEQFVQDVAAGRPKLDVAAVRELADGRVYTGEQAEQNGLIDALGGYQDALAQVWELAGLKGKPEAQEYAPTSFLRRLLGAGAVREHRVPVAGGLLYDDLAARLARGALQPEAPQGSR